MQPENTLTLETLNPQFNEVTIEEHSVLVCTIPDSNADESTACMIKQIEIESFTKNQSVEPSILDNIATD